MIWSKRCKLTFQNTDTLRNLRENRSTNVSVSLVVLDSVILLLDCNPVLDFFLFTNRLNLTLNQLTPWKRERTFKVKYETLRNNLRHEK